MGRELLKVGKGFENTIWQAQCKKMMKAKTQGKKMCDIVIKECDSLKELKEYVLPDGSSRINGVTREK